MPGETLVGCAVKFAGQAPCLAWDKVMVYGSVTGRFTAQDADAAGCPAQGDSAPTQHHMTCEIRFSATASKDFTLLLPWDERDSGALRAFQQRAATSALGASRQEA